MGRIAQAALIIAMVMVGVPAVAKQNVRVELFYNGVWNDHTADLDGTVSIVINHAAGAEQGGIVPTDGTLRFKSPDGRMNPDNPKGPLFGLIGEKTPIRVKVAGDIRISGRAVKWSPRRSLGGTKYVSWVDVTIGGKVRELGQGEPPTESALRRTILHQADTTLLLGYWPMEDGRDTQLFASALPDGKAATFTAPVPASDDSLRGSRPLPMVPLNNDLSLIAPMTRAPTVGTTITFDLWTAILTGSGGGGGSDFRLGLANGSAWQVDVSSTGVIKINYYLPDGSFGGFIINTTFDSNPVAGEWHNVQLVLTQVGADTDATVTVDGASLGPGGSGTMASATLAAPVNVFSPGTFTQSAAFGHFSVWDGSPGSFYQAGLGYPGEKAGDRFARLCAQRGIAATIVGSAANTQPMGAQYPDTDLGLFGEIARTDAGIIHDTRSQEGLTFRTGRSMHNQ